jgi:hypothetical protein
MYSIAEPSHILLSIYNSLGEKIETLINETKDKENYIYSYNAKNLSSGVYFYRLITVGASGEHTFVKKFILLK